MSRMESLHHIKAPVFWNPDIEARFCKDAQRFAAELLAKHPEDSAAVCLVGALEGLVAWIDDHETHPVVCR